MTCAFIADHKIDSYLKLQVLLHLWRDGSRSRSLDELAERLFVGDLHSLETLMSELCQQGVLRCDERHWALHDQPEIAHCLDCLERTFADPLARQQLLRQIGASRPPAVC